MSETVQKLGMGWLPDYPDLRDYTVTTEEVSERLKTLGQTQPVKQMLKQAGLGSPLKSSIPTSFDLRAWCSPIEDQGNLGSCTAHAGVGLVEYFEIKSFNSYLDAARLFLYKTTRNLLGWTGDTGAFIRTTMGAMALFGVPPEKYWPYLIADFDKEPSAFCYAFGQSFQALTYYKLDPPMTPKDELLDRVKTHLAAKLPSMFGFTVYESIRQAGQTGAIPYPAPKEKVLGGHAVCAVGYDDAKKITNTSPNGPTTKGALLIRNSWGKAWGEQGYGWLPYEYVLKGLAVDWWSLLKNEWIATGQFGI
jgi:C1A family cysteine protease